MNIGIDIDGVLTDLERKIIDCGIKMCIEENLPLEIDVSKYTVEKMFNWTDEQALKFWYTYLVQYVIESQPREFAKEIIEKLRNEGNKIFIITARDEYGMPDEYYGKMQELTKQWLYKNNIKYDELIFAGDAEKLQKCIEKKIDVMIEDCPTNISNISSKVKVIKYDCQYNKQIENENITKAYSWYHIYNIIKEMEGD